MVGASVKSTRTTVAAFGLALFSASLFAYPANAEARPDSSPAAISAAAVPDSGCADFRFCVWSDANYVGHKASYLPGPVDHFFGYGIRSAKNRYTDRRVFLTNSASIRIRCLNPGSSFEGPFPDGVYWVRIDVAGPARC
jgi:hypothetical protein